MYGKRKSVLLDGVYKIEDDNTFSFESTNSEPYFTYKIEGSYNINTGPDIISGSWTTTKE